MQTSSKKRRSAGAPSKSNRNLGWLEKWSRRTTVRQIADREFISPDAVRKALKLARVIKERRIRQSRIFRYPRDVIEFG